MLSITLKVRIEKKKRSEKMSWATPPHMASKQKERQLSREWSGFSLQIFVSIKILMKRGGVIGEVLTLAVCGVVLFIF